MNSTLRPWLRFRLAQLLTFFGGNRRAIAQLRLGLAEDPRQQKMWRYLAFVLCTQKENDAALEAFAHALRLDPADAATRFNLGFLLHQLGRLDEAAAHFDEVTRRAPTIDRAWYGLGLILLKQNDFRRAAEKLQEAARLQYFNPHAGYHLAFAWHKLGEHDKARAEYERVKSFDPKAAEQMKRDFGVG